MQSQFFIVAHYKAVFLTEKDPSEEFISYTRVFHSLLCADMTNISELSMYDYLFNAVTIASVSLAITNSSFVGIK